VKTNPIPSAKAYAVVGFVSFTVMAVVFSWLL
jgi:hypothetical protein